MAMIIESDNSIHLDGKNIHMSYTQRRDGTVVYTPDGVTTRYAEHKMPQARYSLAHDKPGSGVAGRAQFEADIRALLFARLTA